MDRESASDVETAAGLSEMIPPLKGRSVSKDNLETDAEWIAELVREEIANGDLVRVRRWSQSHPYGSTCAIERRADFVLARPTIALNLAPTPVESVPLRLSVTADLDEWTVRVQISQPRVEGSIVTYRIGLVE